MAKPHTKLTSSTSHAGAPKSNPMSTAQLPEMPIIAAVVLVLPQRSPRAKELESRGLAILPQRQPYSYGYRRQAFQAHEEG